MDCGRLLGAESPPGHGGQLDAEEGVGVLDRLRDDTRDPFLEQRLTFFPFEPLVAATNIANAPEWSPLPYASNTRAADFRNA